nr:MAG TPA: hypothetical protein [Caudoviricetes sp.]
MCSMINYFLYTYQKIRSYYIPYHFLIYMLIITFIFKYDIFSVFISFLVKL